MSSSVLHVFDFDGTLISGTTASLEVAAELGCRAEVAELEEQLAAGSLTSIQFARQTHRIWAQCAPLTLGVVDEVLDGLPWLLNVRRVCADIRARGEHSMIISMSPAFLVERLLTRLGVDFAKGMPFPPIPFDGKGFDSPAPLTGAGPEMKVAEARRVYDHLAVRHPELELVAYGDSQSDVDLFRALPGIPAVYGRSVSVAVNAGPPAPGQRDLRALADCHYEGRDLWDAYRMARLRLHQPDPITRFGVVS
jgi:phosphoserine phosphatase